MGLAVEKSFHRYQEIKTASYQYAGCVSYLQKSTHFVIERIPTGVMI